MFIVNKKVKIFILEIIVILRFEILLNSLCIKVCYFVFYFIRKLSEIYYEIKLILKIYMF